MEDEANANSQVAQAQAGKATALGLKVSKASENLICFRLQGYKGLKKI